MFKANKVLSAVLLISLVLSYCVFAAVNDGTSSGNFKAEYYDAAELFGGMGVWTDDMAAANDTELITRAGFADILSKVTAIGSEYKGVSYFWDVTEETVGFGAINRLAEAGIVSGNENGSFSPDDNITLYQASKLIVCALGYSMKAEMNGGYSAGYLTTASRLDIINGMAGGNDCITKQDAIIMLYRAMFVGVNDITEIGGNGEATYRASKDETLLTQKYDIYKAEGKITENAYTSLTGESTVKENEVRIDGMAMNVGSTNAAELLGYEVTVYYREESGTERKTIVHILKEEENDVLKIGADDIISFENGVYKYNENDKRTREAKVRVDADVIYNGKAIVYDKDRFIPVEGYVELIKSNGDTSGYNTVIINDIKTIVVNSINMDEKLVSCKYGLMPVDFSDDGGKTVSLKDTNGNAVTLEDIFTWDVISYTESIDRTLLIATVVREYLTGKVTGISDGTSKKIDIEQNEFELSKLYPDEGPYKINVGDKGDFLLDITGKIAAFIKNDSTNLIYGYLVYADKAAHEKNTEIRILSAERGVMKIFEAAENVKLDGTKVKWDSDELVNLSDRVVRYKLNSDGKICEIDTTNVGVNENEEKSLFVSAPMSAAALYFKNGNISGRTVLGGQTVVFVVPENRNEYEKYRVKALSYFRQNYTYAVEAYNCEREYSYADAILIYNSNGDGSVITQNTNMAMVEKVKYTTDDDGLPCYRLYYAIGGRNENAIIYDEVKINGKSDKIKATELTPGSVIRIGTDYKSYINEVDILYIANSTHDGGEFKGNSAAPTAGFNDTSRFLFGYVYLTKDGVIKITANPPSEMTVFDSDNTESRILANFKCMMLDTTGKNPYVRTADAEDFLDYIHYGNDCSKVIVQTKNGDTYAIMIVK